MLFASLILAQIMDLSVGITGLPANTGQVKAECRYYIARTDNEEGYKCTGTFWSLSRCVGDVCVDHTFTVDMNDTVRFYTVLSGVYRLQVNSDQGYDTFYFRK